MRYSTISRCYFAEFNWVMYKILKRKNRAIVMLVKYFVSPHSRCSRRPGLHQYKVLWINAIDNETSPKTFVGFKPR